MAVNNFLHVLMILAFQKSFDLIYAFQTIINYENNEDLKFLLKTYVKFHIFCGRVLVCRSEKERLELRQYGVALFKQS